MIPSHIGVFGLSFVFLFMCTEAFGDIRTTPHGQFRSSIQSGTAEERSPGKDGSSEICVFCHTPAGNGILPLSAPKWQPSIPLDHAYTMYDDIGRAQYGDKPSSGSQSVACLSCHDAAQALSVSSLGFDHPFGVPYRGFLKDSGTQIKTDDHKKHNNEDNSDDAEKAAKVAAKRLIAFDDFRTPSQGKVDDRTVWWVSSTGISAQRTSKDLPLYTRINEEKQEIPYIECTSCHNPHSSNPLFLRVNNAGSKLCLTCHDK